MRTSKKQIAHRTGLNLVLLKFLALVLCSASVSAEEVSLELQIERDKLSMNETTTLHVIVRNGGQDVPMPAVAHIGEFDVVSRGSNMNYQNINGVAETSMTYNLALAPRRVGTFNLGPAELVIRGKKYTSNALTVVVTEEPAPGTVNDRAREKSVFIEAAVDKQNPYVGEQVLLSVKFFHSVNLLSQPTYSPPQTTDFWSDRLSPQRSYYTNIDGKRFRVLEINTALFPTRAGELEIGRAILETQISSKRSSNRTFGFGSLFERGENVNLRTRPIQLKVRPLPENGKPANFSGAVGRFSLSARADETNVEVNTPVSVRFQLQGKGNIKVLPKPTMPELPDFRIYSGTSEEQVTKEQDILGGTKVFEEVFIPKRQGRQVIPSVEYNFFDPIEGKYRVTRAKPITLNVSASTQALVDETPFTPGIAGRVGSGMTAIRYIKKQSDGFREAGSTLLFDRMYVVLNLLPLLAIAFAALYRNRQEHMSTNQAHARSRGANRQAKKRLKRAREVAAVATVEEFFAEIRLALLSFVADKRNVSVHGLTIDEFAVALEQASFSAEEISAARTLIQRADYVRYSSGGLTQGDIDKSLTDAELILVKLQEAKLA